MKVYMKAAAYLLFSVLAGKLYAQSDSSMNRMNLKEAVETALINNLEVRQTGLQKESAEITLQRARAGRFPYLEGVANHGIQQGRSIDPFTNQFINQKINYASYGVNTGLVLFNGLAIHHNIRANMLGFKAAEMEWQQAKDNLTMNVILAYLDVLTNTDLLEQSSKQLSLISQQVERLNILNEEGAILPSQLYDLKGQLAGDELATVNNQNALDASRLNLSQLLNVPYNSRLQVERLDIESFSLTYALTPEQIYETALRELAVVKAAVLRNQSARASVKSVQGELYPTLAITGNVTTNYSSAAFRDILLGVSDRATNNYVTINGTKTSVFSPVSDYASERIKYREQLDNNLFTSLNLGLRIPVFYNLQTRTRLRLARIEQKNTAYIEETRRIQLRQNIEQAYFNMSAAQKRYATLIRQVEAFKESFRGAEERFTAGAINSVEYLIARNNLDRANINLIIARYDYVLRTKLLDFYQGKTVY